VSLPFGVVDEFLIVAYKEGKPNQEWTRSYLSSAQMVADRAIRLGYSKVEVFNTYGGHKSDALYTVQGKKQ
jgi:hypothetical protein